MASRNKHPIGTNPSHAADEWHQLVSELNDPSTHSSLNEEKIVRSSRSDLHQRNLDLFRSCLHLDSFKSDRQQRMTKNSRSDFFRPDLSQSIQTRENRLNCVEKQVSHLPSILEKLKMLTKQLEESQLDEDNEVHHSLSYLGSSHYQFNSPFSSITSSKLDRNGVYSEEKGREINVGNVFAEMSSRKLQPRNVYEMIWTIRNLEDEGSFDNYFDRFVDIVFPIERFITPHNQDYINELLLNSFVDGLGKEARFYVIRSNPSSLLNAMNLATYYEDVVKHGHELQPNSSSKFSSFTTPSTLQSISKNPAPTTNSDHTEHTGVGTITESSGEQVASVSMGGVVDDLGDGYNPIDGNMHGQDINPVTQDAAQAAVYESQPEAVAVDDGDNSVIHENSGGMHASVGYDTMKGNAENVRYEDFLGGKKEKKSSEHVEFDDGSDELDLDDEQKEVNDVDIKENETLSTHKKQLLKIQSKIEQMEKANLEPKSLTMQGEVIAKRPKNSVLQVDLEFEHVFLQVSSLSSIMKSFKHTTSIEGNATVEGMFVEPMILLMGEPLPLQCLINQRIRDFIKNGHNEVHEPDLLIDNLKAALQIRDPGNLGSRKIFLQSEYTNSVETEDEEDKEENLCLQIKENAANCSISAVEPACVQGNHVTRIVLQFSPSPKFIPHARQNLYGERYVKDGGSYYLGKMVAKTDQCVVFDTANAKANAAAYARAQTTKYQSRPLLEEVLTMDEVRFYLMVMERATTLYRIYFSSSREFEWVHGNHSLQEEALQQGMCQNLLKGSRVSVYFEYVVPTLSDSLDHYATKKDVIGRKEWILYEGKIVTVSLSSIAWRKYLLRKKHVIHMDHKLDLEKQSCHGQVVNGELFWDLVRRSSYIDRDLFQGLISGHADFNGGTDYTLGFSGCHPTIHFTTITILWSHHFDDHE